MKWKQLIVVMNADTNIRKLKILPIPISGNLKSSQYQYPET
jgi:hypothetical protein